MAQASSMQSPSGLESIATTKGQIATSVSACLKAFKRSKTLEHGFSLSGLQPGYLIEALSDFEGRFKVWAGSIGAHRSDGSSLGYRLKETPSLKLKVIKLLTCLQNLLVEIEAAVTPTKTYPGNLPGEGHSSSDEERQESLMAVFEDLLDVIEALNRFSISVRGFKNNHRYIKAAKVDIYYFERFDIQYVQDKFPQASEYLQDRMGRAITRRRQFLRYQEQHASKLAAGINADDDELGSTARSETVASIDPEASGLSIFKLDTADNESFVSDSSYASLNEGGPFNIVWPPLPATAYNEKFYPCPFCYLTIDAATTYQWRKHLVQDLRRAASNL